MVERVTRTRKNPLSSQHVLSHASPCQIISQNSINYPCTFQIWIMNVCSFALILTESGRIMILMGHALSVDTCLSCGFDFQLLVHYIYMNILI